jgi:hypothetical protein
MVISVARNEAALGNYSENSLTLAPKPHNANRCKLSFYLNLAANGEEVRLKGP